MTTTNSSSSSSGERVVSLIDMDCFYSQVEEVAAPEFRGKPCGVSQYNPYKGGGLIAVNYEARKFGVKRGMRGEEAKALCPEFHTFFVQEKRGKADLTKYRDASLKIFDILSKNFKNVEKASIDEAYIDLTEAASELVRRWQASVLPPDEQLESDSFVVGTYNAEDLQTTEAVSGGDNQQAGNLKAWLENVVSATECGSNERMLVAGALLVQRVRREIFNTLGFHCSAGIAHNKTLAKLCAGINKPNRQTILPLDAVQVLYKRTPINKIKNLGGKLGMMLTEGLHINSMAQLSQRPLTELVELFGEKTGNWLHQISRGIDVEPVMSRRASKSIGCSKNFRGNQVLNTFTKVEYWVRNLCEELEERLESDKTMNHRDATLLVVHITNEAGTFSKSMPLGSNANGVATGGCCSKKLTSLTLEMLGAFNKSKIKDQWHPVIYTLGISATKFVGKKTSKNSIQQYFVKKSANRVSSSDERKDGLVNIDEDNDEDEAESDEEDDHLKEANSENQVQHDGETNDILVDLDMEPPKPPEENQNYNADEEKKANEENVNKKQEQNENEESIEIVSMPEKETASSSVNSNQNNVSSKTAAAKKDASTNNNNKTSKSDIKSLLIKQAEKAACSVVSKMSEEKEGSKSSSSSSAGGKQKKIDLKTMLLKQAEKAVIISNKENNDDRPQVPLQKTAGKSSSSKVDVKHLLLKQAEKALKIRMNAAPVSKEAMTNTTIAIDEENEQEEKKEEEAVNNDNSTPRRSAPPPAIMSPAVITLSDDEENDDFAVIRNSLSVRLSKSSNKTTKTPGLVASKKNTTTSAAKTTGGKKRLSIELTPVKSAVKNKKTKN